MTSFAESQGLEPFDWNRYLSNAEHGAVSQAEADEADDLAATWPTCACGNLCERIARNDNGKPLDHTLGHLGGVFHLQIQRIAIARELDDVDEMRQSAGKAIDIMHAIEQRAAVLLSEQCK